jgi:CubicO group peptidase (beta-lactamase class C family)
MHSKTSVHGLAIVLALFCLSGIRAHSQNQQLERREVPLPSMHFPAGKDVVEVPFEVANGWMLIPVSVNGSRPLRYVFDTGASGTIHNNPAIVDSLNLKISGKVQARGAGGGGALSEMSFADNVNFNIGGIELSNGSLALGPAMGPGFDGVIGRSIFANLVVEIDWEKRIISFYEPAKYKYSGSGTVLPLSFDDGGRPYAMGAVSFADNKLIPVKLVVDTGAGHTLSLDVGSDPKIKLPDGATKTVLGRGASGEVSGYTGRIKAFEFGGQTFTDMPTTFPDASSGTAGLNGRQGNLGSGILRRFKIIYDYSRKQVIVEPNKFAKDSFGTPLPNIAASSAPVPEAILSAYAGTYGNKEISVQDGGLYYQRIGGLGARLRPIAKDKFALNTDAQITFTRDTNNVVTEMIIDWVERDQEKLKREPPAQNSSASATRPAADDAAFSKELSAYLEQASASDAFSGAVLVAKNGQPIFKKAYGMANKSNNTPNNVDTKFDLGSMNKMFTAVAIAQLVERGKLSFTDTIGKLLPDYPNKAVADKVTVHQLLTHTSGMGSYFNRKFQANQNNLKTVADYLPLFVDEPLAFEPGAKWQYSNSGFVVLGLIIEKVSGQSYYDYVREHIFKPAGMVNTDSYESDKETPNLAIGYMNMGENGAPDPSAPRRPNVPMRAFKGSPAGGGYSTLDDMLKFSVALQNHKLLSQEYTDIVTTGKVEMGRPGTKYAYGFGEEIVNDRRLIGHNGGGPGVGVNFDVFTESGYTAVILGNYDPPAMMPVVKKIRDLLPLGTTASKAVH